MSETPINIPFLPRFHDAIADGTKTWTSRRKPYGKAGQLLVAFADSASDRLYLRLVRVFKMPLQEVAINHYKEEGCASPWSFIALWDEIHPRVGFRPDELVWVHEFRRVATGWKPGR